MAPAASGRMGSFLRRSSDRSMVRWLVSAPMTRAPPSSRMPVMPGTLRRSTTWAGVARRNFMSGTRLWLPAMSFASPPCCERRASASAMVFGAWYSNDAGYMVVSSLAARRADRFPDATGGERHVEVADAERRQRIHHGIGHRGSRGDGSRLAGSLDAERVHRRRRLGAAQFEEWHVVGVRHRVVHERAGEERAVLVVDGLLPERLRDALDDASLHHAVDDHRVDDAPQVVDRDVADDLGFPGLLRNLDHGDVRSEGEHEVARIEESQRFEAGLETLRHVVREVRHQRDVAEALGAIGRALDEELPALVGDVLLLGLEEVRGDLARLLLHFLRAEVDGGAADRSAAGAVAAHAEGHLAGVAMHDLDVVHGELQFVGGDLREGRLVPLAVRVRAGEDGDLAGRVHADVGALVEARLRAERARHLRGSEAARLDVGGDPDAEEAALLA